MDEILPNGTTVRLTMRNYYTDNGAGLDAAERAVSSKIVDEKRVEPPKNEEETAPAKEENKAPEVPVEPDVTSNNETATTAEEETKVNEAPVVETEKTNEEEPEAGVEPAVNVAVTQVEEEHHEENSNDEPPPRKTV